MIVIDSLTRSRATASWANEERVLILRFIYGIPFLTNDSVICRLRYRTLSSFFISTSSCLYCLYSYSFNIFMNFIQYSYAT